jgi:outer membrane protein assembly factor BamB
MRAATAIILACALTAPAEARTFSPKTDNRVVALDLATGALRWRFDPPGLSDAHFEVHAGGLVVFPQYAQSDRRKPAFLDPATGKRIKPFSAPAGKAVVRSNTFWPPPPVTLARGWRLLGFSPGNSTSLDFAQAGRTTTTVWSIPAPGYPDTVVAWGDLVIWALGFYDEEAVIYAHAAGQTRPTWTLDLNLALGTSPARPLNRVRLALAGDVLYAQSRAHLFAIDPARGQMLWRVDLERVLGVPFEPDIYGGALDLASFAQEGTTLVVAFERRVLAIDVTTHKVLWQVIPDTFPHTPYPVIHKGVVYMTAGKQLELVPVPATLAPPRPPTPPRKP